MLLDKLFFASIVLLLLLETAFTDNTGKNCPYDGDIDQSVIDQLNSEQFQATLSPFNELFLSEIPSRDFFFKLFQVKFDKSTAERTFFLNCVHYGDKMNLPCPSIIDVCKGVGKGAAGAVANNLSPIDYFMVVSNTLEGALKEEGELKSLNASATRHKIRTFFNDVAEFLCKPDVQGPVQALFALNNGGGIKYFSSLGVSSPEDVASIAQKFGSEFAKFGSKKVTVSVKPGLLDLVGKLNAGLGLGL